MMKKATREPLRSSSAFVANVVADGERRKIGPFDVEFIPVTHSVPHGFATAFHTPQGIIMHSGDFKIDLTPVDGRMTDLARMGSLSDQFGVRLSKLAVTGGLVLAASAAHTARLDRTGPLAQLSA